MPRGYVRPFYHVRKKAGRKNHGVRRNRWRIKNTQQLYKVRKRRGNAYRYRMAAVHSPMWVYKNRPILYAHAKRQGQSLHERSRKFSNPLALISRPPDQYSLWLNGAGVHPHQKSLPTWNPWAYPGTNNHAWQPHLYGQRRVRLLRFKRAHKRPGKDAKLIAAWIYAMKMQRATGTRKWPPWDPKHRTPVGP